MSPRCPAPQSLLLGVTSLILLASCTAPTAPRDVVGPAFPEAEAEVRARMQGLATLVREGGPDALRDEHLDHPKFSKIGRGYDRQDFDQMIAQEQATVAAVRDFEIDQRDLKVDVFGDVAVATSFPVFTLDFPDGSRQTLHRRGTIVWVRTGDGWKIAHEHNSTPPPKDELPSGAADESQVRAEVEEARRAIHDAIRRRDWDALGAAHLEGPRFTKFGMAPRRMDHAAMMAQERAGFAAVQDVSLSFHDLKIDVFGDVAVATSHPHIAMTMPDGSRQEADTRLTEVWVRTDDGWKLAHEHNSLAQAVPRGEAVADPGEADEPDEAP